MVAQFVEFCPAITSLFPYHYLDTKIQNQSDIVERKKTCQHIYWSIIISVEIRNNEKDDRLSL